MYLTLLSSLATETAGTGKQITRTNDTGADTSRQQVQVDITGSPTAVIVKVNVSVKGDNFGTVATHVFTAAELSAGFAVFAIDEGVVSEWYQGEVDTLTAGSSPTVSMALFWGLI